jgi:hypothetical protein
MVVMEICRLLKLGMYIRMCLYRTGFMYGTLHFKLFEECTELFEGHDLARTFQLLAKTAGILMTSQMQTLD